MTIEEAMDMLIDPQSHITIDYNHCGQEYEANFDTGLDNAIDLAITFMQAEIERQKPCEWCDEWIKRNARVKELQAHYQHPYDLIQHKYCPNCGRKLGEK